MLSKNQKGLTGSIKSNVTAMVEAAMCKNAGVPERRDVQILGKSEPPVPEIAVGTSGGNGC